MHRINFKAKLYLKPPEEKIALRKTISTSKKFQQLDFRKSMFLSATNLFVIHVAYEPFNQWPLEDKLEVEYRFLCEFIYVSSS